MSDVLIKNIQIPKDGKRIALFIDKDGEVTVYNGNEFARITDAIEVPAHGVLIERDELPLNHITDYNLEGHSVVDIEDVLNAPTVIESSKERE